MSVFKTVPELVKIKGKWTIEPFEPKQAAFDYEKLAGKKATLYVIGCCDYHKIGISTEFEKRFRALDTGVPFPIVRVATRIVPLAGLAYAEAWIHQRFAGKRIKGEWFDVSREDALAILPLAVRRAEAYANRCAEWFFAEEERQREPAEQERLRREYHDFVIRNLETIEAA